MILHQQGWSGVEKKRALMTSEERARTRPSYCFLGPLGRIQKLRQRVQNLENGFVPHTQIDRLILCVEDWFLAGKNK